MDMEVEEEDDLADVNKKMVKNHEIVQKANGKPTPAQEEIERPWA